MSICFTLNFSFLNGPSVVHQIITDRLLLCRNVKL